MLIYLIFILLGVFIFFYILIASIVVKNIKEMENGITIESAEIAQDFPEFVGEIAESGVWVETQSFQPVGTFSTSISGNHFIIAAWKHESRPTYFLSYHVAGKVFYDFVTVYMGQTGLTTGSTQDGQLLPKCPGQYAQSFDAGPEILFTRHREAEEFLMRNGGVKEQWVERNLPTLINESLIRQSHYVQTLPLWQVRGPWWYFYRRGQLHNRSVEELHKAGLARLPNDPKFRPFEEKA